MHGDAPSLRWQTSGREGGAQVKARCLLAAALSAAAINGVPRPASADDPSFLSLAAGYHDFNRQQDEAAELRMEYRSDYKLWIFKPFASVAGTSSGSFFLGVGILFDLYFGRRVVFTGSFAPNFYVQGSSDVDLGYPLEFRSQAELAYRFDNRSRLGIAVSHYSNAGLGDHNPGTETLSVYYSIPLDF